MEPEYRVKGRHGRIGHVFQASAVLFTASRHGLVQVSLRGETSELWSRLNARRSHLHEFHRGQTPMTSSLSGCRHGELSSQRIPRN